MSAPRQRIAILGGGMSSLTTAFALTHTEELRARYDITVYQVGWRLGGKGASGRNLRLANRIEEHGLHLFLGFYENAFRVVRDCYAELDRKEGEPLRTWEEAFKKHSYIVAEERLPGPGLPNDGWCSWSVVFPTNQCVPGDGGVLPSTWAYLSMAVQWVLSFWETWIVDAAPGAAPAEERETPRVPAAIERLIEDLERTAQTASSFITREAGVGTAVPEMSLERLSRLVSAHPALGLMRRALRIFKALPEGALARSSPVEDALSWLIEAFMGAAWRLLKGRVATELAAHKLWVVTNFAGAMIVGILKDRLLSRGLDSIDHLDFRAWLARHGANGVTLESAPMRNLYDAAFAFVGGDARAGRFAAGTALRGILRTVFTYKGAFFYKMQAGMGETVFAPLYEVLRRRGVRFEFFHRVTRLNLTEDKALLGSIDLVRQVKLARGEYEPLVMVDGLPCWPSEPLYSQIEGGDELAKAGIHLESSWAPRWRDEAPVRLRLGDDYDDVVLGISVAALKDICPDLAQQSRRFADMLENLRTMQTSSVQLWLFPELAELGWKSPPRVKGGPVLSAYVPPLGTWADMSHLLEREAWCDGERPRTVAYFTGPFEDAPMSPRSTDHGFPGREEERLRASAVRFLEEDVGRLWPRAVTGPDGKGFRWELLVDPEGRAGEARLASQFVRANVEPTERYVLSVPGSSAYRLKTDESGFANLYLTGDWIRTGLNAGCIEAATMAGLLAARAISGQEFPIVGP